MSLKQLFFNELRRCCNDKVPEKVLVALSGGVDSMCLTHLLAEYKQSCQPLLNIHALTIDHGYRRSSSEEARQVGLQVSKWGVIHHIESLEYDRDVNAITNFEEVARNLRYQALQRYSVDLGIQCILVAHTLDDQIETFLHRLQMNSTLYGLNGLKRRSPLPLKPLGPVESVKPSHVCRPLLSFSKKELKSICEEDHINWYEDVTNADPDLTKRNWLRYLVNEYVPSSSQSKNHPLSREALVDSIELIQAVTKCIEAHVKRLDKYIRENCSFEFLEDEGSIKFTVSSSYWKLLDNSVCARWLYRIMYPISSTETYHWSYAKMERRATPRIHKFMEGHGDDVLSMTYLNVMLQFKRCADDIVEVTLKRQPLPRYQLEAARIQMHLNEHPLPWSLFTNIWWIRLRSHTRRNVNIGPYDSSMRLKVLQSFPDLKNIMQGIPVVFDDESGDVIALPTRKKALSGIEVECYIKKED